MAAERGGGLEHLASIALDELPDFPGREQLPADGTLVFFVDFSLGSEGWGPVDGGASVLELIHVAPGAAISTAEPPHEPRGRYDVPVLLNWDEELRFMFGGGGGVTFYGSPEDLRDGRWERVKAMPDSS